MSDTKKDNKEQKAYNKKLRASRQPKMEPYNRRKSCTK